MKFTYIGNFRYSHCTEVHLTATLRRMGHEVVCLQEGDTTVGEVYARGKESDAVMHTRTRGLPTSYIDIWRKLEDDHDVKTIAYHLDLYWGINRENIVTSDPMFKMGYVFTADGGHQEEFHAAGVNHHWMRPGVYDAECYPGRAKRAEPFDVLFVGSEDGYHPEWPYRKELITWLRDTYGSSFRRYGPGDVTVRGRMLNDVYARAKVVVGDSLLLGPRYWSDRVYETIGRGAPLIFPYISDLAWELEDGKHITYYNLGDFDNLRWHIDNLLEQSELRERIRKEGQEYVRENCSYKNRLQEMIDVVFA